MSGYTYLNPLIEDPNEQKFVSALALAGLMIGVGFLVARRISTKQALQEAVVPTPRANLFGIVDLFFEKWVKFQDSLLGKENRRYAPFTASVFFFVLLGNLLGLVPGFPAITTSVWINVGMALVVFAYFNLEGIKANGLFGYIKHFAGPVDQFKGPLILLSLLIFPVEILSTCLRILTLNLRLYWNVNADHMVLGIFTDMVPVGLPIAFYVMGTFVACVQAFIFSVLTMVYIMLATQHEHAEEH